MRNVVVNVTGSTRWNVEYPSPVERVEIVDPTAEGLISTGAVEAGDMQADPAVEVDELSATDHLTGYGSRALLL